MDLSQIRLIPAIIGAIGAMVLGFVWYSPVLFGKPWMKLSGYSASDMESMKKGMVKTYGASFVAAIIMAAILGLVLSWYRPVSLVDSATVAFLVWLGFVATTMITTVLFDKKPFNLFLINSGYQLASILVMAMIFSLI